jgi:hypothetical protein
MKTCRQTDEICRQRTIHCLCHLRETRTGVSDLATVRVVNSPFLAKLTVKFPLQDSMVTKKISNVYSNVEDRKTL